MSNSSIKQTPLSAKTSAPASSVHSLVTGCLWTYAVNPTADAPWPVVNTALWAAFSTYFRNWDLAVPGSPHRRILMSPRSLCFPPTIFLTKIHRKKQCIVPESTHTPPTEGFLVLAYFPSLRKFWFSFMLSFKKFCFQSETAQSQTMENQVLDNTNTIKETICITHYYMAMSHKDWELTNAWIWLAEMDIDRGLDFPI